MSTLKLDTLSNKAGTASVPSDTIVSGTAKAWVNFNGTGTVAIRRAFNVSSITDLGTGQYMVNFATAMPDVNYSVAGECSWVYAGWGNIFMLDTAVMSITAVRCNTMNAGQAASFGLQDSLTVTVAIFS